MLNIRYNVYLAISVLLLLMCIFSNSYKVKESAVVAGEGEFVNVREWNGLIQDYVNARNITLNVDGKQVNLKKSHLYMDENLNLMIPASVITDAFLCACNFYDEKTLVLEKGDTRIEAELDKGSYWVNDAQRVCDVSPTRIGGEVYIPAKLVENGLLYTCDWNIENARLSYVNVSGEERYLPYYYDYRVDKRSPVVKNQGVFGTCWAFASISALESALLPEQKYDFSEENMVLNSGFRVGLYDGGKYTMSLAYLAAWRGPVMEDDDIYGDGLVNEKAQPVKHIQEIQILEAKNIEAIKRAVFFYGGVQSSLYTSLTDAASHSVHYNEESSAYCYIGPNKANHDIVIIGWDDNYPKENFNADIEGNGAFICQNSWGEEFGDNGIFYVSYYDSNIGLHNLIYTGIEEKDNYDNIYQSDICGWVGQLGYEDPEAYFANVYTANGAELMRAVSFYATGKSTEYEVYFVENFESAKSLNKRTLLQSGSFSNAGYYTVVFDEPVLLRKDQKYAVVVRIRTPGAIYPVAVEYRSDWTTGIVDLEDGESFISLKGQSWEHVEKTKECNVCLKVFTDNR